jgi:hypothetical protein
MNIVLRTAFSFVEVEIQIKLGSNVYWPWISSDKETTEAHNPCHNIFICSICGEDLCYLLNHTDRKQVHMTFQLPSNTHSPNSYKQTKVYIFFALNVQTEGSGRPGFDSRQMKWMEFFTSPPRPERLWSPISLLSSSKRGLFCPGVKRPERETDHLPPYSSEFKNAWRYISTPQYVFMAWCLIKHRDIFNFAFAICRSLYLPLSPQNVLTLCSWQYCLFWCTDHFIFPSHLPDLLFL